MQVAQHNHSFGLAADSPVRLFDELFLFFFLLICGPGYRVELRLHATVRDAVILDFDHVLEEVLDGRAFDVNGAPLHLDEAIVVDVDLAKLLLLPFVHPIALSVLLHRVAVELANRLNFTVLSAGRSHI